MAKQRLGIVREHLSPEMLFCAFSLSKKAYDIENAPTPPKDLSTILEHRSYVIGSVLSAVAFLEVTINEVFYVSCDKVLASERLTKDQKEKLSPIWQVESFRKSANILEKYQTALLLVGKETFTEGSEPFQNVKLAIELRNSLTHYVPQTREIFLDQEDEELLRIEKRLKGKFKTNPFSGLFPVVVANEPSKRAEYPFFPEKCFSHGCSDWVANCCLSLADKFFEKMETKWKYTDYAKVLPKV